MHGETMKYFISYLFIYFSSMDLDSQDMMKSQTQIFGCMLLLFSLLMHD